MQCNKCQSTVADDVTFCANCGNNVKQQSATHNTPQANSQRSSSAVSGQPPKPNNNLVICIIGLMCCWPISLVGLLKAVKVDNLYNEGKYEEAEAAAADAKKWGMIGIITGVAINAIAIIFYVIVMMATMGGSF